MPALSEPKPKRYSTTEDDEFVIFEDVPVWTEHTNDKDFDRPIHFGPDELENVCRRCNERIEENGDFPPISIRHNKQGKDAEVVGFAGPFKMGTIGRKNPKAAILATFRIFKEDADRVKKYPRLSVEYWGDEDDPTSGFFDPISLLGSETPQLDLGIRYARPSRPAHYQRLLKYQAAAPAFPGASSTFAPNTAKPKRPGQYQEESIMPLTPEDVKQITDALQPAITAAVAEAMAQGKGEGLPAEGEGAANPMAEQYAKMCEYSAAGDEGGMHAMVGGLDDDGRKKMGDYITANEPDEEKRGQLMKYMAPPAAAAYSKTKEGEADAAKYQRESGEWRAKYQKEVNTRKKIEAEKSALEDRVATVEKNERRAVRYQKLQSLENDGFQFSADEEIEEVLDLDDAKFERHCERISAHYSRIPLGNRPLPTMAPVTYTKDEEANAKYSRIAKKRCVDKLAKGEKKVSFEEEFAAVKAEEESKQGHALAGK